MTMMTNSNDESRNDDTTNSLHFEEMMMNLSVGGGGNSSGMDGESESDQIEMEANELIEDINLYGMTAIPSLYDSIQLLSKYRDICTEKGEYELCRSITRLIDSIRAEKDKIRAREMYQQQMDDRSNIIEASRIEFRDAQVKWRDRMIAFRQELDVQLIELEKKHRTEMEEFTIQFHEDLRNRTPKFSKQLLQLRKVQETLAKQKDFDKALQLKKCADKQQNEELIRLSKENGEKFEKRKSILLNRQKQELLGVRTRALRDQREIELQRDRELKKLKQRFSNIKQTIEGQHSVLESKTRTFLSKFSYGGERSPNSCTPTTIFKNSDINNNNNSNSNSSNSNSSSNTLYHSTSSAIESRMMSSTSHSYSHNNINSVMYQSRPFSIPPSQNPITLSEITKSTATSILNYSQSPTLSHKKYSISEIFNSSSGSLSNRSKSSSPKRPRSSGSYSNRSSSSKASPTTPISQSHQYNNNASKSPSHFRPSTAKNRSVPLSPILHHSVSPNRHLNIPPIRIPDTVPDYF